MTQASELSARALQLLNSLERRHEHPSIPTLPAGHSVDDLPTRGRPDEAGMVSEEQIATDIFATQGPRYVVREPRKQGFFERINSRSAKATYRRETRGGYALSLTIRVLLLFAVTGGSVYGNLFFLEPETARFIQEREEGIDAERQIPRLKGQLEQLKGQLSAVQSELKEKTTLFSSREFFRTRISEFLFELESSGGRITTLCIGKLESKGTLDPCNSQTEPDQNKQSGSKKKKEQNVPPPKGSGQQFSQVYSGFLMGNPFEAAKDAIKIEEIARLDPSFGSVGIDGVILELEGSSESYLVARQSLVRDIPAIVLLGENIKYQKDQNLEQIQLVFSYPYSGD